MLTPTKSSPSIHEEMATAPQLSTLLELSDSCQTSNEAIQHAERLAHSIDIAKRFAGRTAHDFNNIIAVMQGFASILQSRLQPDDKNRQLAEQIDASGFEALKLTTWLSAFANNSPREQVSLDLNALVSEFLDLGRAEKPPEIELEIQLADHLPLCVGDEPQLQELCRQLWENAIEATTEGGKISWHTSCVNLQSTLSPQENDDGMPFVRLQISDTGEGMDQSAQSQIFDPFFTTKVGKGRGLGLTIVFDTVRAHSGFIQVSSKPGQGTTIDVLLPAQTDAPETDSQHPEPGPATLLVVDDEEMIIHMMDQMLTDSGYKVIGVASGEEAVSVFQQQCTEVDLVILDLALSGMSGPETFKHLKGLDPDVKVIVSTGDPHQMSVQELKERGISGVLPKPFSSIELEDLLLHALTK